MIWKSSPEANARLKKVLYDGLDIQIIQELANGTPYKEVSAKLNITYDTVRGRLDRWRQRTGSTNYQIVADCLRQNLIK